MKIKILVFLVIVLIVGSLSLGVCLSLGDNSSKTDDEVVKVLVYSGTDTSDISIDQIKMCLEYSNTHNLTPGVKFHYNTSKVINSQTLMGYDVLIVPGSSRGSHYMNNDDVNPDDLKSFISSGKGFIGICAGAYSAAEYTTNWYQGWGLAPGVINHPYLEVGNVTIQATVEGSDILGSSDKMISHINGPAMYISGYRFNYKNKL